MPLEVSIPKGLTIQAGSYTSPVMKYRRCDRNGCYVEMAVDNALVAGLAKSGPAGKINIVADSGKAYGLNFSLKGFAEAHDDMVSQARAKAKAVAKPGDRSRAGRDQAADTGDLQSNEKAGERIDRAFFVYRLSRLKSHRDAVHAIAQSCRRRAVIKHVPQMPAAAAAMHFGAAHEQRIVLGSLHRIGERTEEAGPAGAAVELCV